MSQEILIKAGQQTRADLVYDEQPGAEVLDNTRLLLQYDPLKLIYLDTVNGSDTNSGYTPVLAKKTYAAAVGALGGSRDTIQVENDGAVIDEPVTNPTQAKRGISASIRMNAANRRYTGTTLITSGGSGVTYALIRNPNNGKIFSTSGHISTDNGLTFSVTAHGVTDSGVAHYQYIDFYDAVYIQIGKSIMLVARMDAATESIPVISPPFSGMNDGEAVVLTRYSDHLNQYLGYINGASVKSLCVSAAYPEALTWSEYPSAVLASLFSSGYFVATFIDTGREFIAYMSNGIVGGVYAKEYDAPDFSLLQSITANPSYVNISNPVSGIFLVSDYLSNTGNLYVNGVATPMTNTRVSVYDKYTNQMYIHKTTGTDVYTKEGVFLYATSGMHRVAGIGLSDKYVSVVRDSGGPTAIQRDSLVGARIQNSIAGFNIYDGDFLASGIKIYSCSRPVIVAQAVEIKRTRSDELQNTANVATVSGCLARSFKITATPATQDAIKIEKNTIIGNLEILNTSATNYELIRDNIIEGGITATFPVTVLSGNTRGANTNAIFSSACFFNDPQFVDLITYKLKYKSQGFTADSPLIKKSLTFRNSLGERRNLGAYSAYETNKTFVYDRAFSFLKPSRDGLKIKKNTQANLIVSIDGTPDVATNPDGQWEELLLSYGSLPNQDINDAIKNHIAFIDYLDTLLNTACEIVIDPDYLPATSAVVNGVHAIGAIVLALDPSNIAAGDRLQIDTDIYFVLYKSGDSVVLHTPLKTAVVDNQVLPVFASAPGGVYQYVPEAPRQLSRWQSDRTDFLRGATLRFVRKWM